MASSLTGIFAPGSPALPETLRTLILEPARSVAPGDNIRVSFSFSNLGGAPATGVRVRFAQPQGVVHVGDADVVDDTALAEGSFADASGAAIGDLEPNAQRRLTCTFRVNDTIEDATELQFQAALATDQTPLVGSNVAHVVVRSRPELQGSGTLATISSPSVPKPGDAITVRATIVNSGSSSAHDVTLVLPAPENTSYVSRSARIDGRVVKSSSGEPFDYDSATIISERLMPGQAVLVEYQATIDSPLADGTRIKASGTVGSRELSEFAISSAEVVVTSPVDFEGEESGLTILSDDVVTPGMRVPMVLRAMNTGTGIAQRLQFSFDLPQGLIYAPGSAHVDGQPVSDDSIPGLVFSLGSLAAGRMVEAGIAATVAVPASGGATALPVQGTLRWRNGERRFTRRLSVRVAPRFSRARNFVEADRGVAQARDEVKFTVHVYNDGTAPEQDVRLRLIPGLHLGDLRIGEDSEESQAYDQPLALGLVEPHNQRTFTVYARVGSRVPDRSNVALGVILEHAEGAVDLGTATVVVRSRPAIESVVWELASHEPLRPNRTIDVIVRVANGGTDVLRDARLSLTLPPELAVERAVDAQRDREGVAFQDVPAESTHEARMTLRLLRAVASTRVLTVDAWLHGKGISPVQLSPLEVPAYAEPQFAQSSQVLAIPAEHVNAGERLFYEIRLRNDGDGPAERLVIRVVPTNLAVYVPASTTLNGMPVNDDSGVSQLWSQRGLVLADVNPNVELRIRWETIVMSPLAADTPIDTRAVFEWDQGKTLALTAPTVRVQAQPSLSESAEGTPISIARVFSAEGPVYEAAPLPPEPEPVPEPPQPPVEAAPPRMIAEVIAAETVEFPSVLPMIGAPEPPQAAQAVPVLYADFSPDRLDNTIRMIERSNVGGLVQHLFAMRMLLFPEHAINASPQLSGSFANANRLLRAPLEKLFVRLGTPRLQVSGKDIEDRESRDGLRNLIDDLSLAPTASPQPPPPGVIRIEGAVELDVVQSLALSLESLPLGAVAPWLINAQLLGTSIVYDRTKSETLEAYRSELLNVFTVLAELPIMEFHRVLTTSVNRTLDESLAAVLEALRGAAHIAVE